MKKYLLQLEIFTRQETYFDRKPILKSTKLIKSDDISYLRKNHETIEKKAIHNNCYVEFSLFENNRKIASSYEGNSILYDKRDNKIWIG